MLAAMILSAHPRRRDGNDTLRHCAVGGCGGNGGVKVPGSGAQAVYLKKEDAERAVESLGLNRNLPIFQDIVKSRLILSRHCRWRAQGMPEMSTQRRRAETPRREIWRR